MDLTHEIGSNPLDLSIIQDILRQDKKLVLSLDAESRIKKCRTYLDTKITTASKTNLWYKYWIWCFV